MAFDHNNEQNIYFLNCWQETVPVGLAKLCCLTASALPLIRYPEENQAKDHYG